ncbi:MAG TPA: histidine phosphatase family protein [Herpetosiphonaceae bacterium]
MTTIVLIRHGETEWNRSGRWQGQADVPLSEDGRQQAQALARRLKHEGTTFDHLYASDLSRALETAQAIGAALRMPVHPFPALREINVGSWSGLTRTEIMARFPGAFTGFFHSPDGESLDAFRDRVGEGLVHLAQRHPGERLAIVTHGGTIRSMLQYVALLQGQPDPPSLPFIGNTSLTELEVQGGVWRIVRLNDLAHLDGDQAPDMLSPQNESAVVSS